MKKVIMVCFLLFAFLYVSIGCEDDKGGSYSMTGTVTNVMRQPLAGRTLQCITYYDDISVKNDTLTRVLGTNGEFSFKGLEFGNYELRLITFDTLDYFRTFTDTNGVATRKPVYSNGRFIGGRIGMLQNEVVNDTVQSSGAIAVTIKGVVLGRDTLKGSTGLDSIYYNRSDSAYVSLCLFPGTNWSNPVKRVITADTTGAYEVTGIPRVNIVGGVQTPFVFNCRIDRRGYAPVLIDSIVANASEIDLGTVNLRK